MAAVPVWVVSEVRYSVCHSNVRRKLPRMSPRASLRKNKPKLHRVLVQKIADDEREEEGEGKQGSREEEVGEGGETEEEEDSFLKSNRGIARTIVSAHA